MAEERETLELLESQLREMRGRTRGLTDRVPDDWLYRRVEWTDHTIGWHMAHLARALDIRADEAFGTGRRMGEEWDRLFTDAAPAGPDEYPEPDRVRRAFSITLNRFLEQLGQVEDDTILMRRRRGGPKTLLEQVLSVVYHEGEHANAIATLLYWFEREAGVASAAGAEDQLVPEGDAS